MARLKKHDASEEHHVMPDASSQVAANATYEITSTCYRLDATDEEFEQEWTEAIHNGGPVNWGPLARLSNLTTIQAARLAHCIDPFRWPDPNVYEGGLLPANLAAKVAYLEQRLRGLSERWSLSQLVATLGPEAPRGMRLVVEALAGQDGADS